MKKILVLISFLGALALAYADLKEQPIFDFSGGLYTNDEPERIDNKYTPDCLNVLFDRVSGVVKRNGYTSFLTSALPEGQPIRSMYEYRMLNNTRYIIFNSSWSVYAGNSSNQITTILNGQNPFYTDNYSTGLGMLLRDNGVTSGHWDGATYTPYDTTNSTGMVYGRYNCFFQDYWFKAGVTGYLSSLYWSLVNTPGDFSSFGSGALFVGNNDGDIITGLYPSVWGLMIFKRYSTWLLVGSGPQNWTVTPLSTNTGALFQSTIANYQNYPMFMSWRGIELYNGVNFNLVSLPIDNIMRNLSQSVVYQNSIVQDNHSDWENGSGVNIDITTNPDTVAMSQSLLNNCTFNNVINTSVEWNAGNLGANCSVIGDSVVLTMENLSQLTINTTAQFSAGTFSNTQVNSESVQLSTEISSSVISLSTAEYSSTGGIYLGNDIVSSVKFWYYDIGSSTSSESVYSISGGSGIYWSPVLPNYYTNYGQWVSESSGAYRYWIFTTANSGSQPSPTFNFVYTIPTVYSYFNRYTTTGTYISDINLGITPDSTPITFSASYTTPSTSTGAASSMTFQYRTYPGFGFWGSWTPISNGGTFTPQRFIELQSNFFTPLVTDSTTVSVTPTLTSMSITPANYSGRYISPVLDFGQSPYQWGNFNSDYSLYYSSTGTGSGDNVLFETRSSANSNMSGSSAWQPAYIGQPISSPVNEYLQILSSMTPSTDYMQVPIIYDIKTNAGYGASFTTQVLNAGSSWGQWGSFSAGDNLPGDSIINYYINTSNDPNVLIYLLFQRSIGIQTPADPISDGSGIASNVGPYALLTSSFVAFGLTTSPSIDSLTLGYYSSAGNPPFATVYRDGYWLAVSTDSSTGINNVVISYDRFGRFSIFNDIYMGSACLFYNNLYTGSSDNSGMIYHQDIPNMYTDRGLGYRSYVTTKNFDCGMPGNEKNFHYAYCFAKNSGAWNMYAQYRLNGEVGNYTPMDFIDLSLAQSIVQKINFPINTSGWYVQFKLGNDAADQDFSLRGFDLIYDPYPLQ